MTKPFTILVTGANGQVGSELTELAQQQDKKVIATARNELDITSQQQVDEYFSLIKPDLVINAAAYTAVDRAEKEPELAYAINQMGTACLARACKKQAVPLFHISTDYVFDGRQSTPYRETDLPAPLSVYGKSKLAGEKEIQGILEQYIILRVAWVFGKNGNNFVKTILRLAQERDSLNIVNDQYGGPTAARDIAETLLHLGDLYQQKQLSEWGIYHYCGRPITSWYDFTKKILQTVYKLGYIKNEIAINPITTEEYPTNAQRPQNSAFNCEKIRNSFKIDTPDWQKGLLNVLSELKSSNNEQ